MYQLQVHLCTIYMLLKVILVMVQDEILQLFEDHVFSYKGI